MSMCSETDCEQRASARGLCPRHYTRAWYANGKKPPQHLPRTRVRQPCSIDGCDELAHAHGLCSRHASAQAKYGDPLARRHPRRGASLAERVAMYSSDTPTATGCIMWTGSTDPHGRGSLYWQGKKITSNRAAWMAAHGPIPDGLHVLHSCDNPGCVTIEHLHLGDHAANMREKAERGRAPSGPGMPRRTDYCKHGHDLSLPGATYEKRPAACVQCARQRARDQKARKRADKQG